jgi:hypothetical protein
MDDDAELVAILGKLPSKVNPHTFADYRIRIRPRGAATASARSSPAAPPAEYRPSARPARRAGLRQVRHDHTPLCVGQIGLVSGDGRRCCNRVVGVHIANPRLVREMRALMTHNPFSKTAADKSAGD